MPSECSLLSTRKTLTAKMIQVPSATAERPSSPDAPTFDKDAALAVVSDEAQEIDPAVEKRVLRKIDLFFMPAMLIGRFLIYV